MNKNHKTKKDAKLPFRTSEDVYNEMDWAKKKALYYLVGVAFDRKKNGKSIEPIDVVKDEAKHPLIFVEEILKHYTDEEFNFLQGMLERVKNGKLNNENESKEEK